MPVIGIDIGGTAVKLGVVRDGREIIYRDSQPSVHDPDEMVRLLCGMIMEARRHNFLGPVAISTAGAIDQEGYLDANQLNFWHVPLGKMLEERLGEQVLIENDGICALLGEHREGALQGIDSCLMITLGTGIGGGVMVEGRPLRGYRFAHAELGHMITHVDGKPCSCGQRGCWEAYASASALKEASGGLSPRAVIDQVRKGAFQEAWRKYLHELAQGLISLCSIFYPQAIALGGGLSGAGRLLLDGLQEELRRDQGYQNYYRHIRICLAQLGNNAGLIGAAAMVHKETV